MSKNRRYVDIDVQYQTPFTARELATILYNGIPAAY
jgi:hypothetical protein